MDHAVFLRPADQHHRRLPDRSPDIAILVEFDGDGANRGELTGGQHGYCGHWDFSSF
jgi:hypothetical protein